MGVVYEKIKICVEGSQKTMAEGGVWQGKYAGGGGSNEKNVERTVPQKTTLFSECFAHENLSEAHGSLTQTPGHFHFVKWS